MAKVYPKANYINLAVRDVIKHLKVYRHDRIEMFGKAASKSDAALRDRARTISRERIRCYFAKIQSVRFRSRWYPIDIKKNRKLI